MKYVLDANVATAWVLSYLHSANAIRLRDDYRQQVHELDSPCTFLGEVASALTKAERQKIIKTGEGRRLLSFEATEISSQTRSSFYDCLLLTLAKHESLNDRDQSRDSVEFATLPSGLPSSLGDWRPDLRV